jgi:hypothetical protein
MNIPFVLRGASAFVCVLAAVSGVPQDLPARPPSNDPAFWGRPNKPYRLKLTLTNTPVDGNKVPQTHVSEANVSRDSAGRVRTEDFYDNGAPWSVTIRDPVKNTFTQMMIVPKKVWILSTPPVVPPPVKTWVVERLPARVIEGIPAEGFRFTRTVPASDDGNRAADTLIEEDWISNDFAVVLERKIKSERTGTRTETVSQFKQAEPDPSLFTIPSEYKLQPCATCVSP